LEKLARQEARKAQTDRHPQQTSEGLLDAIRTMNQRKVLANQLAPKTHPMYTIRLRDRRLTPMPQPVPVETTATGGTWVKAAAPRWATIIIISPTSFVYNLIIIVKSDNSSMIIRTL
jgi:hypothetical protein